MQCVAWGQRKCHLDNVPKGFWTFCLASAATAICHLKPTKQQSQRVSYLYDTLNWWWGLGKLFAITVNWYFNKVVTQTPCLVLCLNMIYPWPLHVYFRCSIWQCLSTCKFCTFRLHPYSCPLLFIWGGWPDPARLMFNGSHLYNQYMYSWYHELDFSDNMLDVHQVWTSVILIYLLYTFTTLELCFWILDYGETMVGMLIDWSL